jgi:hypothetical protein
MQFIFFVFRHASRDTRQREAWIIKASSFSDSLRQIISRSRKVRAGSFGPVRLDHNEV